MRETSRISGTISSSPRGPMPVPFPCPVPAVRCSAPRRRTFPAPRSPTAAPPHRTPPGGHFGGRIHQRLFPQPNRIIPTLIFFSPLLEPYFSASSAQIGVPSRTAPPGAAPALHAGCRGRAPGGARDLLSARRGPGGPRRLPQPLTPACTARLH